jgi:transcriptional regulator with XRE-family HTH domain
MLPGNRSRKRFQAGESQGDNYHSMVKRYIVSILSVIINGLMYARSIAEHVGLEKCLVHKFALHKRVLAHGASLLTVWGRTWFPFPKKFRAVSHKSLHDRSDKEEGHKGHFQGSFFVGGIILPFLSFFVYTKHYLSWKRTQKKRMCVMPLPNKRRDAFPLRAARLQRQWSQRELAERVGATVATVKRWERQATVPGPYFRLKLTALFGTSEEALGLREVSSLPAPLLASEATSEEHSRSVSPATSSLWTVPYLRNPLRGATSCLAFWMSTLPLPTRTRAPRHVGWP